MSPARFRPEYWYSQLFCRYVSTSIYGAIGSCGVGRARSVVKAGRTASFRNATTVGGEKESNMFDFKMFDSEHRAWLSEGWEA